VTDAELVCLAVAQVLLRYHDERHWLRGAPKHVGHLFPQLLGEASTTPPAARACSDGPDTATVPAIHAVLGDQADAHRDLRGTLTGFCLANPKLAGELAAAAGRGDHLDPQNQLGPPRQPGPSRAVDTRNPAPARPQRRDLA